MDEYVIQFGSLMLTSLELCDVTKRQFMPSVGSRYLRHWACLTWLGVRDKCVLYKHDRYLSTLNMCFMEYEYS